MHSSAMTSPRVSLSQRLYQNKRKWDGFSSKGQSGDLGAARTYSAVTVIFVMLFLYVPYLLIFHLKHINRMSVSLFLITLAKPTSLHSGRARL